MARRTMIVSARSRAVQLAGAAGGGVLGGAIAAHAIASGRPASLVIALPVALLALWAASKSAESTRLEIDDEAGTLVVVQRRWPRASMMRTLAVASIRSVEVARFHVP